MPISDVMAISVVTADADTMLSDVAARMIDRRVGSALVCEGPMLLGIVTERDVLRAVAAGLDPHSVPVGECMTPAPVCASPDWEIDDAARLMVSNGIRHLPVTQDGNVAGMVSMRDLVRFGVAAAGYGSESGRIILEAAASVPSLV